MNGKGLGRFCLLIISAILWFASTAIAQVSTGTISGVVKDSSGAILPGVNVTVKHVGTGQSRVIITDDGGRYRIPQLALGDYEVQAELAGFQTSVRRGITMMVGMEEVVDLTLTVGEISEQVEVTGEAPQIETSGTSLGGVVDTRRIEDLPLNGRNYFQLATLQPGVTLSTKAANDTTGIGRGEKLSIAGSRISSNIYTLDGTVINNKDNGNPAGLSGNTLGVDTIREFRVLINNYSAEFGRSSGGRVSVVSKSGTNKFHGTVFEFLRNSALDTRNFFDGDSVPPFKRNQYGFELDGPIIGNKTFFVGSYEGLKQRLSRTTLAFVPNANARIGIIPGQAPIAVNSAVVPYLNLWPLPNTDRNLGGGIGEYVFQNGTPLDENFFTVKIDHELAQSDSMFARYTYDGSHAEFINNLPTYVGLEDSRHQIFTLEERKTITPKLINVFRFGLVRYFDNNHLKPGSGFNLPPPNVQGKPRVASLDVPGIANPTDIARQLPRSFGATTPQLSDQIFYTVGIHGLSLGAEFQRHNLNLDQQSRNNGVYTFDTLADLLRGAPARAEVQQGTSIIRGFRESYVGFYFQDDIKWKPTLTVNAGLRYEFITTPTEVNGRIANLVDPLDRNVKDMTVGAIWKKNPSLLSFAPRLGFAWDPFGNGRTAVRGGFGMFYDQVILDVIQATILFATPFSPIGVLQRSLGDTVPFPFMSEEVLRGSIPTARTINYDFGTPYSMQYNLNIQREIAPTLVMTVGYAGAKHVKLIRPRQVNVPNPEIINGQKFFRAGLARPNRNFSDMVVWNVDATGHYDALLVGLSKNLSRGLQFQVSYTFSKSMDQMSLARANTFGATITQSYDAFDRSRDNARSDFDARHNFSASYNYELPLGGSLAGVAGQLVKGWNLGGIVKLASGAPFSVGVAGDRNRDTVTSGERPSLRPGANSNPVHPQNADSYFDISSFEPAASGFYGNLGRNTIIGSGLIDFDFSLRKDFSVAETGNVSFRAEFFNIFNRANFQAPRPPGTGLLNIFNASGVPALSATRLTATTTTSRQIQFGVKLSF